MQELKAIITYDKFGILDKKQLDEWLNNHHQNRKDISNLNQYKNRKQLYQTLLPDFKETSPENIDLLLSTLATICQNYLDGKYNEQEICKSIDNFYAQCDEEVFSIFPNATTIRAFWNLHELRTLQTDQFPEYRFQIKTLCQTITTSIQT